MGGSQVHPGSRTWGPKPARVSTGQRSNNNMVSIYVSIQPNQLTSLHHLHLMHSCRSPYPTVGTFTVWPLSRLLGVRGTCLMSTILEITESPPSEVMRALEMLAARLPISVPVSEPNSFPAGPPLLQRSLPPSPFLFPAASTESIATQMNSMGFRETDIPIRLGRRQGLHQVLYVDRVPASTGEPLELDCIVAAKAEAREKGEPHKWAQICLQLIPIQELIKAG